MDLKTYLRIQKADEALSTLSFIEICAYIATLIDILEYEEPDLNIMESISIIRENIHNQDNTIIGDTKKIADEFRNTDYKKEISDIELILNNGGDMYDYVRYSMKGESDADI